jgi:hypothetical protein
MLDITKDIQSLTNFRRKSREFLKQMKKSRRSVVLTVNGKAEACCKTRNPISDCSTAPLGQTFTRLSGRVGTISSTDERVRLVRCSTSCAGAMAYLVELTLRAERDLDYLYVFLSA